MYYESRVHKLMPVSSSDFAAKLIKSGHTFGYEAISWTGSDGKNYLAVNDASIDDKNFAETAVLLCENGNYFAIESITVPWESLKELRETFREVEKQPYPVKMPTQLLIDAPDDTQRADFICGCCGESFNDLFKKQLTYDQDSGYGICPDCQKYYD